MKNDIIIISQQPWDTEIGSNCKNIALELSKTCRVLYVNTPLDRITVWRNLGDAKVQKRLDVIKGKQPGLVRIQHNLWTYYPDCMVESINWITNSTIFNFFNKSNNRKLSKSIKKAIETLNFKDFMLFNDNEMFKAFYLKDYLKPLLSVYYSRDYMLGVDYWRKHGVLLEPKLIAKSDLCFANSAYLANYCKSHNERAFNVGQGCDIESFKNAAVDSSSLLGKNKKPIVGYVGALSSARLDIETIVYLANSHPNMNIVLVGPEDDSFKTSGLHDLKNVNFLGQMAVDELPAIIACFDVCINPQLINAITIGNYPRKIDEYLALGKPVVATRTETMEFFSDHVYLANNKEEYAALIDRSLMEDSAEKIKARKAFAFGHTWENSVGLMRLEMEKAITQNNK